MSDFSRFANLVKDGAAKLAIGELKDFAEQAKADAVDFLRESEEKLRRWTGQLASKQLTAEEFEILVRSQEDLAKMAALAKAGAALAAIQRVRDGLINLVVSSATKVFLPG